jgi:hypothetical protein
MREDRRKADEERRKADEDRRRADEDRRRADARFEEVVRQWKEDRRQAEHDRRRFDATLRLVISAGADIQRTLRDLHKGQKEQTVILRQIARALAVRSNGKGSGGNGN